MIKTSTEIRVFDCHIDGNGHVNQARYLEFLQSARLDFWLAHDKAWFDERKIGAVVAEYRSVEFKRPCFLLDTLSIDCEWESLEGGHAWVKQTIKKGGKPAVIASCRLVFINTETGKAIPLEDELLAKLVG
jgi:thioesterase-3